MENDYNNEPVFYCKQCLSLKIKSISDLDYCDECGSTEIDTININEWEKIYEEKYGKKYINREERDECR